MTLLNGLIYICTNIDHDRFEKKINYYVKIIPYFNFSVKHDVTLEVS